MEDTAAYHNGTAPAPLICDVLVACFLVSREHVLKKIVFSALTAVQIYFEF